MRVIWHTEVASTSDLARQAAEAGLDAPLWIAALRQTGGRGRLGRVWQSPPGNLYATWVGPWNAPLAGATGVAFASGLAVSDLLLGFAQKVSFRLKWPNDVRVSGAKIAGILVEGGESAAGRWLSIGIGVNLAVAPDIGQPATALAMLTKAPPPSPEAALDALVPLLAARLAQLAGPGFAAVRADWLDRAEGIGAPARAQLNGAPLEGRFAGLDWDGAMLLHPEGAENPLRITAGDVQLLGVV